MFFLISITVIIFTLIFLSMYRAQRDGIAHLMKLEHFDEDKKAKTAKNEKSAKDARLYFFYMDGCGWCERFLPIWEEAKTKYASVRGLQMRKVEKGESVAKEYSKHVEGYPTILLVKPDDTVVKFGGERTVKGIETFLKGNGVDLLRK